jgi:uncharacterized protein YyaL (SSP411 family)
MEPVREDILPSRNARPRPARDEKILADWNGLMIASLAEAGFYRKCSVAVLLPHWTGRVIIVRLCFVP